METFLKETDMSLLGCVVVIVVGFALFKLELEDRPGKKEYFLFCFCLYVKMNVFVQINIIRALSLTVSDS